MDGWTVFRRLSRKKRKTTANGNTKPINTVTPIPETMTPIPVPKTQKILLLYGPKQPYKLVENYPVPEIQTGSEVLVRTRAIGLNPIDWKAP